MKKILVALLLSVILLMTSCCSSESEYKVNYKLTYKVHYLTTAVEYTYNFKGNNAHVYLQSNRGTNYIVVIYNGEINDTWRHGTASVCSTTAPIEIVSLEVSEDMYK